MALQQLPSLIPSINLLRPAVQLNFPASWRMPSSLLRFAAVALPVNSFARGSTLLQDIWESVLRAVPKKKTTHSKTRMRQLAGKALKDVTHIVKCPSCGQPKRGHYLCPTCVYSTKLYWKGKLTGWKDRLKLSIEKSTARSDKPAGFARMTTKDEPRDR